jgi:glycosyltransferase involved in cell wall biosynthesis
MDRVTIVIVTYNAAATLRQCIDSIIRQQYPQKEIVVVDGGSSDETCSIISAYGGEIARWKSETDKGIYDAMNKGIRLATGKWILFLGADDTLHGQVLHDVFSAPSYTSSALLLYGRVLIQPGNRLQGGHTDFEQLIGGNIPHQGIFYDRQLLLHHGGYDLHYPVLADYDLNLRIFQKRAADTYFLDRIVAEFSSRGVSNRTIDAAFFTEKLAGFRQQPGLRARDPRLASYHFYSGLAYWLKKEYGRGLRNMLHSWFFSRRPLHYVLHTGAFFLALLGVGRRFRLAPPA